MVSKRCRNKQFIIALGVWLAVFCFCAAHAEAQQADIVDKTMATVSDGVRLELITYSDLIWQLALEPDVAIEKPNSDDLNRALQLIINQRLFALEAQRLPRLAPSDAEIETEIKRVLALFPSTAEFERRLNAVGFKSIKDDNFQRMMAQRVAIEKYLDFRFRSFAVITPDDEAKYYRDVFTPDFRRRYPGLLMPSLDEKRTEINRLLVEQKVADEIQTFLDEAEKQDTIVILSKI